MGSFEYGSSQYSCTVEDEVLVHLETVIIDKLRHGERFALHWVDPDAPGGGTTLWMAPDIPVQFVYTDPVRPQVSVAWLRDLTTATLTVDDTHVWLDR